MIAIAVDDEILMLGALVAAVKASPDISEVTQFSDCEEALDFVKDNPVDIAFLDINMRGMGGLALAEKIRIACPDCKIVFCTGYEEYAIPAFKLHASGYLMKPVSAKDVQVIIPILLNCLLVLSVYLTDKYTPAKKLPYIAKQIIIGLLFGGVSAFASSYGVEWLGTTVNVRDAAPLSAGLIFGAPAGIISGLIGGLYRWFSVYWGGGMYTRLACSLATILAGFMAAGLRKLMFDNKKPTWSYGICIAVVCEVIHMILIFLTNMDNSSQAFEFVKGATAPMMLGNSVAVGVSIILVSLFSHERFFRKKTSEGIAHTFQRRLLSCNR